MKAGSGARSSPASCAARWLSAVLAGGLLVALAIPALQLRMAQPGPDTFPKSLPAVQAYDRMQERVSRDGATANVVVKAADVTGPAVQAAIDQLEERALASGRAHEPITVDINDDATVANITIPIEGKGTDAASKASLAMLRDEVVPTTVGALPGRRNRSHRRHRPWTDSTDAMTSKLPFVIAFVLVFAFGLMLVAFRSIVIAAKAIVLNLLSVAAAYGVLVLVFQQGFGKNLLGFTSTAGIDPVVPLLLFVILFGLSMDYHVFILGRIREAFQRGATTDEAIAQGIKSTAGVVTSAAIVMVAVFGVFIALSMLMFKQFGLGLAVAILIDATIVRGVLLPAAMKLLGDWNVKKKKQNINLIGEGDHNLTKPKWEATSQFRETRGDVTPLGSCACLKKIKHKIDVGGGGTYEPGEQTSEAYVTSRADSGNVELGCQRPLGGSAYCGSDPPSRGDHFTNSERAKDVPISYPNARAWRCPSRRTSLQMSLKADARTRTGDPLHDELWADVTTCHQESPQALAATNPPD